MSPRALHRLAPRRLVLLVALCSLVIGCKHDATRFEDADQEGSSDFGTGQPGMLPPAPPDSDEAMFACKDGRSILTEQVCDGFADCEDGADERPCFRCQVDGQPIRHNFTCDGIVDCADASDESCVTGEPGVVPAQDLEALAETCVRATPMRPRINSSCVTCLCGAAPKDALACDATCWDLLECVLSFCPNAAPGSSEQSMCAIEHCGDSLGAASTAMAVGATLRSACSAICPPF